MSNKRDLYVVLDIETTKNFYGNNSADGTKALQLAFDVAWQIVDRKGNIYQKESFVAVDVFQHATPYFKQKLGLYIGDSYSHFITPVSFSHIYETFNSQVQQYQADGHRVIICAYNASFDTRQLSATQDYFTGKLFFVGNYEYLDIWHTWGISVPFTYVKFIQEFTDTGMYFRTTAETAYKFEAGNPDFIERHIAWNDVEAETLILLKALNRTKADERRIVKDWRELPGAVWRHTNERLQTKFPIVKPHTIGKAGETPLFTQKRWYQEKLREEARTGHQLDFGF